MAEGSASWQASPSLTVWEAESLQQKSLVGRGNSWWDCGHLPGRPHAPPCPETPDVEPGSSVPRAPRVPPAAQTGRPATGRAAREAGAKNENCDKSYFLGNETSHPGEQRGRHACELVCVSSVPSVAVHPASGACTSRAQAGSPSSEPCAT